jgi:hypothetical protein
MICCNCAKEFNSLNWYKYLNDMNIKEHIILCDECLVEVFEARIQSLLSEIGECKDKIYKIKGLL